MIKHKKTSRLASRLTSWVLSILLMVTALPMTILAETPADTGNPFQGEILFPFNEGNGSTSSALSGGLTATLNNYVWDTGNNGRGGTSAIYTDKINDNGLSIDYGLQFASVNDLTMGVWVKPTIPGPGQRSFLMAPPYAGTTGNWGLNNGEIFWNITWGTVENNYADTSISFCSYGSDSSEWDSTLSATAGSLADGNWHYLAFSFSATAKTVALYLDGNRIGEKTYSSTYPVNLQSYKWFGGSGYVGEAYTGLLDELSVLPSVLDDTAHLTLYNRAPDTSSPSNPDDPGNPGDPFQGEILLPFNEGNGSTSSALSGGLTATLNEYIWDVDNNGRGGSPAISSDNTGANGLTIDYGAQFASVNDLTMGVWVKPTAPSPGTESSLMAPPYAGTNGDWGFSNGEIWWKIVWGTEENNYADTNISFLSYGSDGSAWDGSFSATAGNLADGNWHYLAFSYSTTTMMIKLYVDGNLIGEKSYNSLSPVNLQAYKWFGGNGYQGRAYTGLLDELSVFPSALDAAAQAALYNRAPDTSSPGDTSNEILFPFNEGNGKTSSALSGGLTATLNEYIWDVDNNGRGGTSSISNEGTGGSGLTIDYGPQFASVNDLTMGVWVKPAAPSPGKESYLMAPPYAGTNGDWGFNNGEIWWDIVWGTEENNYADTSIKFLSYGSDGSGWDGGFSATAGNLADGNWHYLAFSYSTTTMTIKLYADGKMIGEKNYTSLSPVNLQAYKWFGGNGYQGRAYTGLLDELSVFPSALDAAAQEALYNRAPNTDGTGQQSDPADTDQVGDNTYYVAKTGSDSNPGTEAEPFLTIQKAADVLLPGEAVIIHEGVYEESVRPKYNGTADHPITYKAADGEKVVISGADLITGTWQTASNPSAVEYNANDANLWKVGVSLPMGNYRNQVFVDGEAMLPARYPNVAKEDAYYRPNWLSYVFDGANASVGGWSSSTGKLNDPELNQPAGTWDGAAIVGMDNRGWNCSGAEVVSSTPGWLNLTNINFYELGPTGYAAGNDFPYYIQNAMAALDAPYEWFYDQNSGTLYLQLPNGENPNNLDVRYKAREWGLDLSSRKYIHIEGIDLNGCNLTMRDGEGNVVDKMTAKYVTEFLSPSNERGGIIVGGRNNTLINSEIAYSAGALVTVEGEGNKIVNCKLHDATTGPTMFTFSITITGRNHLISHNEVYNASSTLIGGSYYGCEISYNDIHDGNWHSSDCGLMYSAYTDLGNSQIHHNKIHDSHNDFSNGVYFDLGCKNAQVYDNVFWNLPWAAVFTNSSSEFVSVYNNTVFQGAKLHPNPEIYTNSPGDAYMDVYMNNIVDSRGVGTDNVSAGAVVKDNYSRPNDDIDGTATFTNPSAYDFTLKSGSGAVGVGAYQPGDTWDAGVKDTPVTAGEVSSGPQILPYANRNLLSNSGFEWPRVDVTGMGSLPYWKKTGIGSASLVQASSSADNAHAREQYSVQLTGQNIGLEQTITGLEPGKDYVLRGFGRMGSGSSADGQKVEIGVRVGEDTLNGVLDRPAWRSVSIKFTADETGTATVYATKTTAGSQALVDDFSVVSADLVPDLAPPSDDLYPMLKSPVALLDDMLYNNSSWTVTNQSSFVKDEPTGITLEAQPGQSAAAFYTQEKYGDKDFYLKLGENENLDALDLAIILRANAATRTANRYEIAIHGTTATLNRYYSGTCTQLGQWTVDINDRLLKAGAVWDDVNGSGYGGVTVTLKSGNSTLFSYRDENNLNVSAPGYFGVATDSSIKLGRVTEYVEMSSIIADKSNWESNSSITWENNDTRLTPVGSAAAGYTGRTFGDAEFVMSFNSGMNTGAFPCFLLRAPTQQDLLDNPWSGAKYSVIIKEGSFEIQHWPEIWKPGASILSGDGRSALADNKSFVPAYRDTLVKVSTVNTDYGVWIRLKAGDTIVASWIDENNYIQNDGYFGVCGYTEPLSISVPDENTYVPVIGDPDAKPGTPAVPSVIDTAAIAGITAPVADAIPVSTIADTSEYTAAIVWSPADTTFAANTVYTATITITPKTGYTLTGVPENFFTVAGATATNAADSGVVTAVFPATAKADSKPKPPVEEDEPTTTKSGNTSITSTTVQTTTDSATGTSTATVETSSVASMVDKAKEAEAAGQKAVVEIKVESAAGAQAVEIKIPKDAFSQIADATNADLKVDTEIGSVTFDAAALSSVNDSAVGGDISFSVKKVDSSSLPEDVKAKVGNRPVFNFSLKSGDTAISSFGGGSAQISIPYTRKPGEKNNSIVVYYIDDAGKLNTVMGRYDHKTGTVNFSTSHFSNYTIGYNEVNFSDVSAKVWYNEAVGFMAARGITKGVGGGRFAPDNNISRGDFLVMVMNAYNIELDKAITDNFSDSGDKYYAGYLGTAKRLGLVAGIGGNKYAPEATISRQDMLVILYRVLEKLGKLPSGTEGKSFESFSDKGDVAGYSGSAIKLFVEAGIISGDGSKLNPRATCTRAQVAQVLYNLLSK